MMRNSIPKAREMRAEILAAMDLNTNITARDRIIIRRVLDGESCNSVAKDFDIGGWRVRDICFTAIAGRLGFDLGYRPDW